MHQAVESTAAASGARVAAMAAVSSGKDVRRRTGRGIDGNGEGAQSSGPGPSSSGAGGDAPQVHLPMKLGAARRVALNRALASAVRDAGGRDVKQGKCGKFMDTPCGACLQIVLVILAITAVGIGFGLLVRNIKKGRAQSSPQSRQGGRGGGSVPTAALVEAARRQQSGLAVLSGKAGVWDPRCADVQRFEWDGGADGSALLRRLARRRKPAVIVGAPAALQWAADPESGGWGGPADVLARAADHLAASGELHCQTAAPGVHASFMYFDDVGEANSASPTSEAGTGGLLPDVGAAASPPRASLAAMSPSAAAVAMAPGGGPSGRRTYCTDAVEVLAPSVNAAVARELSWMRAVGDGQDSDDTEVYAPSVWLGSRNATTQLHYDGPHNLFIQVSGRKNWVILPPDQASAVHLYPELHPRARKSQVDFERLQSGDASVRAAFPRLEDLRCGYQVELQAGEALYVPPFWLHHVSALDPSVSVNVFSRSAEQEAASAAASVPFPFEEAWPRGDKVAGLHAFLHLLIEHLGREPCAVATEIVQSRYDPLDRPLGGRGTTFSATEGSCYSHDDIHALRFRGGLRAEALDARVEAVADALQKVRADGTRHLILSNYIELAVGTFMEPTSVSAFLSDCLCSP